jgi:hypothetical protein
VEAFAVYLYLFSRYPSERPTSQDIVRATGMNEVNVKSALQTLLQFELQGACADRSIENRIHEMTRHCLRETK